MVIKHKRVVTAEEALTSDPVVGKDEWNEPHTVDVTPHTDLTGVSEDIALVTPGGKTVYLEVFPTKAALVPPDPLNDLTFSISLYNGYVAGDATGTLRTDLSLVPSSFTVSTVNATKFGQADKGTLQVVVSPVVGMPPPPPQITIGLSSEQDKGQTENLGQIRFGSEWFDLPSTVFLSQTGDCEIEYSDDVKFVKWFVTGDISLLDGEKVNPNVVSISGDGTIKATYKD